MIACWISSKAELGVSPEWADANPETLSRLIVGLDNAARWCDQRENHSTLVAMLSGSSYVGVPSELIPRLLSGSLTVDPDGTAKQLATYFTFHGQTANFPWIGQALRIYSQMVRWRQATLHETDPARVFSACRPDIYRKVLEPSGTPGPLIDIRVEGAGEEAATVPRTRGDLLLDAQVFIDRSRFDPSDIEGYAAAFPIRKE